MSDTARLAVAVGIALDFLALAAGGARFGFIGDEADADEEA